MSLENVEVVRKRSSLAFSQTEGRGADRPPNLDGRSRAGPVRSSGWATGLRRCLAEGGDRERRVGQPSRVEPCETDFVGASRGHLDKPVPPRGLGRPDGSPDPGTAWTTQFTRLRLKVTR